MQQQGGGTVNNFNLSFSGGEETHPSNSYPGVDGAYHSQEGAAHMSAGYNNETQAYDATEAGLPAQSSITYEDRTQQEQMVVMEQNTYVENNYVDNSTGSTTYVDNSVENTYIDASADNTTDVNQNQYQDNSTTTTTVDNEYVDDSSHAQQDQYQDNSIAFDYTNNYVDESQYSEQTQYVDQDQGVDQDQYVEQGQYAYQAQGADEGETWTDTDIQQEVYYSEGQQTVIEDESGNGGWGDSTGYDGEGYGDWTE